MALGRAKVVYDKLADIYTRAFYMADILAKADVSAKAKIGDTVDFPEIGEFTVGDAVDSNGDLQDVNAQAHGLTAGQMTLDQQPMINVQLGAGDESQAIGGDFAEQLAKQGLDQLRNEIDTNRLALYFLRQLWDATGSRHVNVTAAALTSQLFIETVGACVRAGAIRGNLVLFISPEGEADLVAIPQFTQEGGKDEADIGISRVGKFHGIPVYATPAISRNRTVASTGAVTTSGGTIHTYTVGLNHGLVPGQLVTVAGHDADENVAAATAISAATTTTVSVTTAATNDGTSADTTGTITTVGSPCLLLDKANTHVAFQKMPQMRRVQVANRWADNVQMTSLLGRRIRPQTSRVIHL